MLSNSEFKYENVDRIPQMYIIEFNTTDTGGFPNEIINKVVVGYLIICCYHNFIL